MFERIRIFIFLSGLSVGVAQATSLPASASPAVTPSATPSASGEKELPDEPVNLYVTLWKGIYLSSPKGDYTAQLYGFIQADGFVFNGNTIDTVNHVNNFSNGVHIPAARLYFGGILASVWQYLFSYDFAISQMRYAFLNYMGWDHVEWKAGQYKPGFSLDYLTSRTSITFLARALPVEAFVPGYAIGSQLLFHTDHFVAQGAVFGPNSSGYIQNIRVVGYQPLGASLRLVFLPMHQLGKVFHVGIGGYYREAGSQHLTNFRSTPEIVTQHFTTLVNTGDIANSNDYHVENAEIAGIRGPFSAQAEYYLTNVDRFGESGLTFSGYYVLLSYFLTGESRTYRAYDATFSHITPVRNKYGAWELAARYSNLDLDSQHIAGGVENNMTLALNWYPINRIKFGFNYIFADATPSSSGLNRQMNIFALRLQTLF